MMGKDASKLVGEYANVLAMFWRLIMRQVLFCLIAFLLLTGAAEANNLSGNVSISYSDGTAEKVAHLHVSAIRMQEFNAYIKPLLPDAAKEYAVLRAEWTDLVLHYTAGMTDTQKQEYERKNKALFESFDGILPRLLTGFHDNIIASTTTDNLGRYSLNVSGDFYVTVLASAEDLGTTVHHIWLVPSTDISGNFLVLDQRNEIPSVTSLYYRYYPKN